MSTTIRETARGWRDDLWRCVACGGDAGESAEALACETCGCTFPIRDGLIVARERTSANNEVARNFYDGPLWPKFRFWERFTWATLFGERRARDQVLKHLPQSRMLKTIR